MVHHNRWGKYDLNGIIGALVGIGATYNGPNVVSNEFVEEKQMWCMTFNRDITVLGDVDTGTMTIEGPLFVTESSYALTCKVETIILPKTINRIGAMTFFGCTSLSSIEIPNNVTSIGQNAFYGCTGLTSVTIGNSVTSIGDDAFRDCTGLTSVKVEVTTPPTLGLSVFNNTNDCPIYVPSQSVDAYKAATNWSEYEDRIVGLLDNNQIRYFANLQLTIKDGVGYTNHMFDNGVGIVTFNNDLTTLKESWFAGTFDNYLNNIIALALPNGVSTIEKNALQGAEKVGYEGTRKECARIYKETLDGIGVDEYYCFDGRVSTFYNSNRINLLKFFSTLEWFKNLIGEEKYNEFVIRISSILIDEHPMTANDFISALVNGTQDTPGLSTYGFTVITYEVGKVTTPLAYHNDSKQYIGIGKVTDYNMDITGFVGVGVNESLDPDYMYILFSVNTDANVTIVSKDGTQETVTLHNDVWYADQGYVGYYSQNTYDSNIESVDNFLVDNRFPIDGETIYDYCNNVNAVTITINRQDGSSEIVTLDPSLTYAEHGYIGFYYTDTYDSGTGDFPHVVDDDYPSEGAIIYDYCNDIYVPEPEPEQPYVNVAIEHQNGTSETITVDSSLTYSEQGYAGHYSQNTYNSVEGEYADSFLVDNTCPYDGEIIYDYCNDIQGPTDTSEEPQE